jgi:hypothetical protein
MSKNQINLALFLCVFLLYSIICIGLNFTIEDQANKTKQMYQLVIDTNYNKAVVKQYNHEVRKLHGLHGYINPYQNNELIYSYKELK